jgi:predicted small metal-binding protein
MAKHISCGLIVDGCEWQGSAPTEEELVQKVVAHAGHAHGVTQVSPELAAQVKAAIQDR